MNLRNNLRLLALIVLLICASMAVPLTMALAEGSETAAKAFFFSMLVSLMVAGMMLCPSARLTDRTMSVRDGYFIVSFAWIAAASVGALPFLFSGCYQDYGSAMFEIMSGFTTTGCTVLREVESVPKSILFWRSLSNWLGGMGIVVLFVALIPSLGSGGTKLYSSEVVGPSKDKLTPKSRNTAMVLWLMYVGMSVLAIVSLLFAGIGLYDAVTTAFSTVSTAGFCVRNASVAGYSNPAAEVVVIVFMFFSGVSYSLFFKAISEGPRAIFGDSEFKTYAAMTICSSVLMALSIYFQGPPITFAKALRDSFFQFVSLLTTTGFTTADYRAWPTFAKMILFMSMFIGGCAGSTAGGVKFVRLCVVMKGCRNNLKSMIHPRGIFPLSFGGRPVPEKVFHSISVFLLVYYAVGFAGGVIISLCPNVTDMETAVSAAFLCLGNIGAGFGSTENFFIYPQWSKFFMAFLMLMGRLELFTMLTLFTKDYWKK